MTLFVCNITKALLTIDGKYPTKYCRNMFIETKHNNKKQQNMNKTWKMKGKGICIGT
jgi:hypothetical protein